MLWQIPKEWTSYLIPRRDNHLIRLSRSVRLPFPASCLRSGTIMHTNTPYARFSTPSPGQGVTQHQQNHQKECATVFVVLRALVRTDCPIGISQMWPSVDTTYTHLGPKRDRGQKAWPKATVMQTVCCSWCPERVHAPFRARCHIRLHKLTLWSAAPSLLTTRPGCTSKPHRQRH